MISTLCEWDTARFLIFSDNSIPLIYYSHITSIIIFLCLFALTFIQLKNWPKTAFRIMALSYSVWLFCDLVLWANEKIPHVMFFWTLINLAEPLIFVGAATFFFLFAEKKTIGALTSGHKWLIFGLLLPTLIMAPIGLSTVGFDMTTCDRNVYEGIAAYYNYFIEALCILFIIIKTCIILFSKKYLGDRLKLSLIALGLFLLLSAFLMANFFGTFLDQYDISQYGHIAVPVFAIFLAYITIRFQTFEPRILLVDTLVTSVIVLILSLFFAREEGYQIFITGLTFFLALPMGYVLVTSIRKEIRNRKQIQILADNLEQTNKQLENSKMRVEESNIKLESANDKLKGLDQLKTEFLSLAAHQLRSPLTAIRGYTSMLLDGSYGSFEEKQKDAINRVFESSTHLSKVVEDLLNVSKIEAGGMKYEMAPFDMEKAAKDLATDLSVTAEKKGLKLTFTTDNKTPYTINGDMEKIRQVMLNIIDNAIKYTEKGSITVGLSKIADTGMIRLAVTDTGMGISPDEKEKLFQKFSRGAGGKTNTGGSGLGLYLAKQIAEAHGGHIVIDSPGVGLGSTFSLELKASN